MILLLFFVGLLTIMLFSEGGREIIFGLIGLLWTIGVFVLGCVLVGGIVVFGFIVIIGAFS